MMKKGSRGRGVQRSSELNKRPHTLFKWVFEPLDHGILEPIRQRFFFIGSA